MTGNEKCKKKFSCCAYAFVKSGSIYVKPRPKSSAAYSTRPIHFVNENSKFVCVIAHTFRLLSKFIFYAMVNVLRYDTI